MKVTHRLYFAALPSAVGALTVAALAYWGQYARAVPAIHIWVAALATLVTFLVSWRNVQYVARRIEQLARGVSVKTAAENPASAPGGMTHTPDELDRIAGTVSGLSGAVRLAQDDRARALERAAQRNREQTEVLAQAAASAIKCLDEVRLPLHILIENHFGELNDNQEEMLGAARAASDVMDNELQALSELAGLELGTVVLRRDRVFPADVLHAILPTLRAQALARGVQLEPFIAPLVAPILIDAPRMQRAILDLLSACLGGVESGTQLKLELQGEAAEVVIMLAPAAAHVSNARTLLARRVIEASGGAVTFADDVFAVRLRR